MKKTDNPKGIPQICINDFARVQKLFSDKNWPVDGDFGNSFFENFCNLIASYNEQQRELIFSLSNRFLWVNETQYYPYFAKAFNNFVSNYDFSRGKKIYITPLLPQEDFGKAKSSIMMYYLIKAIIPTLQQQYNEYSITYSDSPDQVDFEMINNGYTLCLVDDFIGTGETVRGAVYYFTENGITLDNICVVALVGMNIGVQSLIHDGYSIFTAVCCPRGISDSENSSAEKIIMDTIEEKMKVQERYRYGYGASEALVKMMRTPNNTFPVYWLRKNNKFAPFPR